MSLKSVYSGLKKFQISMCQAILADKFGCLSCCRSDETKRYLAGQEQIDRRLDVVKLMRTSMDLEIMRKLYLLPRQRSLWRKQRQHAIRTNSPNNISCNSDPSSDSDGQLMFDASNDVSLL